MSKLSIKEEMRAIDCRVKGWWESLTEEEVKKISPFVLMRWTSAVQSSNSDIEFHYIALVNELVNKHYNIVRHHPELQFKLLQCVGLGVSQYHKWIPPGKQKKQSIGRLYDWLKQLYPTYNDDELELLVSTNDISDFKNMAEELGLTKKQIKEIFKK
jgi:hypothetical protein